MKRIDLYYNLGLNQYFEGDAFVYKYDLIELDNADRVYEKLNTICSLENLRQPEYGWYELDRIEAEELLTNILHFDLIYNSVEQMKKELAVEYQKILFDRMDSFEIRCYSSWEKNPWKHGGVSGFSVTESTVDVAISLVSRNKAVLLYMTGED